MKSIVTSHQVPPENALLWPKPQQHTVGRAMLRVDADAFLFTAAVGALGGSAGKHSAGTLPAAFERYRAIMFRPTTVITPRPAAGLAVITGLVATVATVSRKKPTRTDLLLLC